MVDRGGVGEIEVAPVPSLDNSHGHSPGIGGIGAPPALFENDDCSLVLPQQEEGSSVGLDMDYYDVMIVGMTGQGKSTTSDKMIVSEAVREDESVDGRDSTRMDGRESRNKKLTVKNLTFWMVYVIPKHLETPISDYLKNLELSQALNDPHLVVNKLRENGDTNPITATCQLISNDATNMRVLDVPGFFSVQASDAGQDPSAVQVAVTVEEESDRCTRKHLALMREILRVQSTMQLRFRRIMYFLPVRGGLEKPSVVLMQELRLLARYFGRSIFDSMVLVATAPTHLSQLDVPEVQRHLFTEAQSEKSRVQFQKALKNVLVPSHTSVDAALPNPPLLFISMRDTCESIVEKVKTAQVEEDSLELRFHPGICIKCASTINSLEGVKVETVREITRKTGKERIAITYEESRCHPIFLPRPESLQEIVMEDGTAYVVIRKSYRRQRNPDALAETCPSCDKPPGNEGCMKVGSKYKLEVKGESFLIPVDHSNQLEEHRPLRQVRREKAVLSDSDSEEEEEEGAVAKDGKSSRVAVATDTGGTSELVGVRLGGEKHKRRSLPPTASEPSLLHRAGLADMPDMKG